MARMKKADFDEVRKTLSEDIGKKDENQALADLELVKNRICDKVKTISQVADEKKETMAGFTETLNSLKDELEEQVIYKTELEAHLRRLASVVP